MLLVIFVGFGDLTGCNYFPLLIRSRNLSARSCSNFVVVIWRLGGGALFVCDLEILAKVSFCLGFDTARRLGSFWVGVMCGLIFANLYS